MIGQLFESTGINVQLNDQFDSVFNQKNEKDMAQFLFKNVQKDSIEAYAFSKTARAHKLANANDKLGGTKCARERTVVKVGVVRRTEGDKKLAQQKSA